MNMLLMIYDADFDEDVMKMLATHSVAGYTKWERVLGKGKRSDPKLGDAVWPGYNCAIAVVIDDIMEDEILSALKGLHSKLGGKGFVVFEFPVLRVL